MKQFLQAVTVFILLSFCICPSVQAEPKELNWIGHWKDADKRTALVNEVKKEFEFLHPEVRLNFVYDVDIDAPGNNYKWKNAHAIVDMIKNGNIKWDVIFLDVVVYQYVAELLDDPLWGKKHLVDFSTVPGFLATQKDFIKDDPSFKEQTGGIFTGPYIEGLFYCFWYNKEVAQQAGIEVRERKMRVSDLLTYAKQLSEYNKKNHTSIPLIRLGAWNRLDTLFEYLYRSQLEDTDIAVAQSLSKKKEKVFFDTLLIFEKLSHYQPILNSDWETLQWEEWQRGFLENKGLFIAAGTFMYNHFMTFGSESASRAIPVEYPIVSKANGLVGLYTPVFAVMKDSPNKEAAIDLLMLWSEPKIAEKWINYTRNPTGVKGHLDEPAFQAPSTDVYSRFVIDMTKQYCHLPMRYFQQPSYVFGTPCPVSASEFRENLALILTGRQTAAEYLNKILQRLEHRHEIR